MVARKEVTLDWLKNVLIQEGYEIVAEPQVDKLIAKHPSRPNIIAAINRDLNVISFVHSWKLKKPDLFHHEKQLLTAINTADSMSWYETFYRDKDGDLGVSSILFLTEQLSEADVADFLRREAAKFTPLLVLSKLKEWMV